MTFTPRRWRSRQHPIIDRQISLRRTLAAVKPPNDGISVPTIAFSPESASF
jgi:hypothetical protein